MPFPRLLYPSKTTARGRHATLQQHVTFCPKVKEPAWNVMGDKFQAGAT
jgi:hypothetical protein